MTSSGILLVNPNVIHPPIAPVGLEYLAAGLEHAGYSVDLLDVSLSEQEPEVTIACSGLLDNTYLFIGVSARNIDDSYFASRDFCMEKTAALIETLRNEYTSRHHSCPPVVLGGVGFSIFPEVSMRYCDADFGIIGDSEEPVIMLAEGLNTKNTDETWRKIPGLLYKDNDGSVHRGQSPRHSLPDFSLADRHIADNVGYFKRGGMIGFETTRGCPRSCAYCPEPSVRGTTLRLRPASEVADEIESLLQQGITHFHTCDSECNLNRDHLVNICREFIERGLGEQVSWYAYCVPTPFDEEMADLMRAAGCRGIDFTVDSMVPEMLTFLRQPHTPDDVRRTVALCRKNGIATMLDLLLGVPGETRDTIARCLLDAASCDPDCIGISLGVRLYPGTALWDMVKGQGYPGENPSIHGWLETHSNFSDQSALFQPVFYLEHTLGTDCAAYVSEQIHGDSRFMFGGGGTDAVNYNYNQNLLLDRALEEGYRGAYWHILSRLNS